MPLASGMILGQYEIRSPLGAGGMGEVYRAYDTRLGREVAIKVLPESLTSTPDRLRRFEQEARATAALNHPNILAVYQMASHEGISYIVEELLEGETLRDRLRRGPLPLRKAIDYAVQIAHGLAAPHEKGIVHRDLKPENLFLTNDGRIKILDFGLAKMEQPKELSGIEATLTQETAAGVVIGTVGYMSPEQVRGKTADHRSDIFAFGTILYELVTSKQTFRKPTSAETMSAILNEDPPSVSQLAPNTPPGLQRVVHRCLEKHPEQRFQSASDLAFALEALSDSATTPSSAADMVERRYANRLWIGIVAIAIALGTAVSIYVWDQSPTAPKVSNYVQLTHDGQPKNLVGTDGSRLYLFLEGSPYLGLAEMSSSGGELRKIPILPSPDMTPIDMSPDGSQLLVVQGQGVPAQGPLWTVPVLGGYKRRIADTASDAAWSPDGRMVAYSKDTDLFVARSDGSESRKVTTTGDGTFVAGPVWSPEGTHIRFISMPPVLSVLAQFWEVSTDGAELHRLLPGWTSPPDSECCGRWTSDGKYFVFHSRNQIWALPRKISFFRPNPKPIQLTFSPLVLSSSIPSKDGKKLFVVGRADRGELMRYDLRTKQWAPFLRGISAEYIDFSKDARWVTYVSFPEGTLWRSRADGSERLQLAYPPGYAMMPRWSPDGKTIVFFESLPGKPITAFEISSDGGNPRELLPSDPHFQIDPNWSPDGSKIVFSQDGSKPESEIRILNLKTNQVSTLPGSKGLFSPRWSPDGRHIPAFSFDSKRLLVFDFESQKWTELASGTFGWLNCSSDGQYLEVLDFTGGGPTILKVGFNDGKLERITDLSNFPTTGQFGGSLSMAPDGAPLILRNTGTQDVYALDWEAP